MVLGRVLITGVHKGLGHALAHRCLEDGARVFGLSRELPGDLAAHEGFRFVPLDLRCLDKIPVVVGELLEGVDALDLVLLNAGVLGKIKDLKDTSIEELREVMDLNVWANKFLLDALLEKIRVSQVIAISSGAAFNGSGGWGAYSISKSALNLLVRVYANEHPGTHFTSLAPGIVHTDMLRTVLAHPGDPRYAAIKRILQAQAESRVNTPEAAASQILRRAPRLRNLSSGVYADIRQT